MSSETEGFSPDCSARMQLILICFFPFFVKNIKEKQSARAGAGQQTPLSTAKN